MTHGGTIVNMSHGVMAEWHGHTISLYVDGQLIVTFHTPGPDRGRKLMAAFESTSDTPALRQAYADGVKATMEAVANGSLEYSNYHTDWAGIVPQSANYQP